MLDLLQDPSRKLKETLPVVIGQENGFAPHLQDATVLQFPDAFTDAQKSALLTKARLEVLAFSPDRDVAYVRSREGRSAVSTSLRMNQSFGAKVMGDVGSALEFAGAVSWAFVEGGLQGAKGLATGVYQGGKTIVTEPFHVVADDLATGYILAFQPEWADYYEPMSGIRKAVEAGYEPGEIVYQAAVGVGQTPGRFVQALVDGDSEDIGHEYVNLAALILPFKGSNLSFPEGSIGLIPVGQRMTAGGAIAMEYAQVTIRTVTIDGVEIAKGTLIAMSEITGNAGGTGGVGGGDPAGVHGPAGTAGINEGHVFDGEINNRGKAVGYHHRTGGVDPGSARVTQVTDAPNAQGVYLATVEVFDSVRNSWIPKETPSSFYPDNWSRARVLSEIQGAFENRITVPGRPANFWEGVSPSGVRIRGYLTPAGDINTAFPVY